MYIVRSFMQIFQLPGVQAAEVISSHTVIDALISDIQTPLWILIYIYKVIHPWSLLEFKSRSGRDVRELSSWRNRLRKLPGWLSMACYPPTWWKSIAPTWCGFAPRNSAYSKAWFRSKQILFVFPPFCGSLPWAAWGLVHPNDMGVFLSFVITYSLIIWIAKSGQKIAKVLWKIFQVFWRDSGGVGHWPLTLSNSWLEY